MMTKLHFINISQLKNLAKQRISLYSTGKNKQSKTVKSKIESNIGTQSPVTKDNKSLISNSIKYESKATPTPPKQPIGPGASKEGNYKNTEYYSYNEMSYFDLECEMIKDRCPQPKAGNEFM